VWRRGFGPTRAIFNGKFGEYVGREMVFGVRPEDLLPRCGGCDRMSTGCTGELPMVVKVVEPLVNCQDVYLEFGDSSIMSRCGVEAGLQSGERVTVRLELDRIYTQSWREFPKVRIVSCCLQWVCSTTNRGNSIVIGIYI